ncbi:MAG: M67 family metallopeptidase [Anaerolineae bacterium]|jgi:proteasome lid subunit RPN8/RPN11|nr:M67 family metallopeptidase [Anaerolineae bacterium]MBT7071183.1 M67 family metallopeptidase [Anaerolineae bacterium]MBT7324445.1 M67 family metallopeptidase [Anaerolineae bacterium]
MLKIPQNLLDQIHQHLEETYPEEGVGFLLGMDGEPRVVTEILIVPNAREKEERHHRYDVAPQDIIDADETAEKKGLSIIGVFHSHPEHPDKPSEFDRERAHSFFSYIITSVEKGKSVSSRSWRLLEDRSKFIEEEIEIK